MEKRDAFTKVIIFLSIILLIGVVSADHGGGDTITVGVDASGNNDPLLVKDEINKHITDKKLPYTTFNNPLLRTTGNTWPFGKRSFCAGGKCDIWGPSKKHDGADHIILDKACEILGYDTVDSDECLDVDNKCNYDPSGTNKLTFFDKYQGDFVEKSSLGYNTIYARTWISKLVCSSKLKACNDKVDNNDDDKIDALVEDSDPKGVWIEAWSQNCATVCSSRSMVNVKDSKNHACTSGERRSKDAIKQLGAGIFKEGCWNIDCVLSGDSSKPLDASGNYCYSPGQKRDNDKTDITAACYCEYTGPACNDGIDNDGDGKTDFCGGTNDGTCDSGCASVNDVSEIEHDPECSSPSDETEGPDIVLPQCSDGIDNSDNDGLFDFCGTGGNTDSQTCDPHCSSTDDTSEATTQCNDGISNDDGDDLIDAADPDCWTDPTDSTTYDSEDDLEETTQCNDGYDNDDDGSVDLADSDCTDGNDLLEGTTQCNDGIDNNGDDLADYAGVDIDGDGIVGAAPDFQPDPTCTDGNDPIEGTAIQCSDAFDNDADTTCDTDVSTCDDNAAGDTVTPGDSDCFGADGTTYNPNDPLEGQTQCNDGLDNDGDDLIDELDPDCLGPDGTYDPNIPIEGVYELEITGSKWTNMIDETITTADLNDLVTLSVTGEGFSTQNIKYEIFKKCDGIVECIDFFIFGVDVAATIDSTGSTTWKAGQADAANGGLLEAGTYYFIATVGNEELTSVELVVSDTENPNSAPHAEITSPLDKQIYFLNEELTFSQDSYDEDDAFTFKWEDQDGVIKEGDSSDLSDFIHPFSTTGQKNIKLTVTDDRELIGRDQISILVINSTFILAYIDKPLFGEVSDKQLVNFDATSTYAINEVINDAGERTITCLYGKCPAETAGCPPDIPESERATKCPINVVGDPEETESGPKYSTTDADGNEVGITFDWTFTEDGNPAGRKTAVGIAGVDFEFIFPTTGNYLAELTTSINPSSSTSIQFIVDFVTIVPKCFAIENSNDVKLNPQQFEVDQSYWLVDTAPHRADDNTNDDSGYNNCFQSDGVGRDGHEEITACCPNKKPLCNSDTGICGVTEQVGCAQFKEEDDCKGGNEAVAKADWESRNGEGSCSRNYQNFPDEDGLCAIYTVCKCIWDQTNGCIVRSKEKIQDRITPIPNTYETNAPPSQSICKGIIISEDRSCDLITNSVVGSCGPSGTGQITINWIGIWHGNEDTRPTDCASPDRLCCPVDGKTIQSCGEIIRLPFFGMFNILITISILTIFYFFQVRRENKIRIRRN